MSRRTSFEELYSVIGAMASSATGRSWWQKNKMQSRPAVPYLTVHLEEGVGLEQQVVEQVEMNPVGDDGEVFRQTPWGTLLLHCKIEFYKDAQGNSARDAATRVKNALHLEERFWDLWDIAGLVGSIRFLDISGAFRADIEPRAEIRFTVYANVSDPLPLVGTEIFDIQSTEVDVVHVQLNDTETDIKIDIDANQ